MSSSGSGKVDDGHLNDGIVRLELVEGVTLSLSHQSVLVSLRLNVCDVGKTRNENCVDRIERSPIEGCKNIAKIFSW